MATTRLDLSTCTVDLETCTVVRGGQSTVLTDLEARLLRYLVDAAPRIVPRDELLTEVWEYRPGVDNRGVVDALLRLLRKKVEREGGPPEHVVTVRGHGYRFQAPPGAVMLAAEPELVGRAVDLGSVAALLAARRLVTVVGPPGVGKTRLISVIAARSRQRGDPVHEVDLVPVREAADVVGHLATALALTSTTDARLEHVAEALAGGPGLLVLDNLEHVADEVGRVVQVLLEAAPALRILGAGRRALGVPDEHVHALQPLATDDARELFLRRSHGVRARDPALAAVVEATGGLPLAVELGAAQTRLCTVAQLAASLTTSGRVGPAPLDAAMSRSWDLLSSDEQRALLRLSVLEDDVEWTLASAILAAPSAEVLGALLDHSLLARTADRSGTARLRLHPPLRAWCRARLPAEEAEVARRHAVLALAGAATTPRCVAVQAGDRAVREAVLADEVHLEAAVEWGIGLGLTVEAAHIARLLGRLRWLRGPYRRGLDVLERVLAEALPDGLRAQLQVDRARLLQRACLFDEAADVLRAVQARPLPAALEAEVEEVLGVVLLDQGADEAALDALGRAQAGFAAIGDRRGRARVLGTLGTHAHGHGDVGLAEDRYQRALRLLVGDDEPRYRCLLLSNLAVVVAGLGRPTEAEAVYREALEVARAGGDRGLQATIQLNLGAIWLDLGQPDAAQVAFEEALDVARSLGDAERLGHAWTSVGYLHEAQGRHDEARRAWGEGLGVVRRWGVTHHELRLQIQLAELERRAGDRSRALAHADRALELCVQLDDPSREARLRYVLGELSLEADERAAAVAHLERGIACARAAADGTAEAYCRLGLAECAALDGAGPEAVGHLERGQALLYAEGLPRLIGEGWCLRARVELRLGDRAAARRSLAEAEAVRTSLAEAAAGPLLGQIADLTRRLDQPARDT